MRQAWKSFIFIPLTLLITAPAGYAGGEEIKVYTLEEGIQEALQNNWSVKADTEKITESEFAEKASRADLLPSVSTSYGYVELSKAPASRGVLVGDRHNYEWTATAAQPIFTGYALTSAHELAKLGIDQSKIAVDLAKLDLALQVKVAYFNILKAGKAVGVAKSAVESIAAHLVMATHFCRAGITPANDVLKADVELANARQNYIKAQNDLRLARVSFNVLLLKSVEDAFEVEDILVFTPETPDFNACLGKALKTRPEMKALGLSNEQADQQIRLARSGYYPTAKVSYSYIKAGDTPSVAGSDYQESDEWQVVLGASWTVWDFNKTRSAVGQRESQKRQLFHAVKNQEDNIRLGLKRAILNLKEAEEKIPTAEKAVQQAEENLRVNEERYKAQVTTSTEVLDAETLLTQARMNYYSALYDHNLSRAALQRAVGEY